MAMTSTVFLERGKEADENRLMPHTFSKRTFKAFCNKMAAMDADLASIIKAHGYPPMWNRPNTFETLVHIILEQQVSLASALSALNKLKEKIGAVTPENLLKLSDEDLRACYFSRQKAAYTRHLANAITSGALQLDALVKLPSEEVRNRLIALKGIGHWTVDIYLIFVLQRLDVFPMGDLAAVNALKRVKQLPKDTPREALEALVENWKPYRTVATMLLWHYYLSVPQKTAR